jgi:signal transduction histidine kinase
MLYLFIIALIVAVVLGFALYSQRQAGQRQAQEQQQLLADYQRRVDEQQKLLDDYRALEKNFDNIGEGYEQALLAFDKMEEDQQKVKTANEALEKRNAALQQAHDELSQSAQKKGDALKEVISEMVAAVKASGDTKMAALVGRLSDLDDLQADLPPFEPTDNIMVSQIADEAVRLTGIAAVDYIKFEQVVDPSAAATMIHTNLNKAARALTHLLDNALKFTTEGSVTLNVDVDMEKMQALFKVTDTGTGIAAEDAEKVFEPYVKLNQFFGGQGIGLTVARNIARRLGGDLLLDTAFEGPGARFVLTLPL